MLHRCYTGVTVLAMSGMLMAGCVSAPRSSSSATPKASAQVPAWTVTDDKLVDAHAHYAQGILHDLNGEQDDALQEFAQAAQSDPANEELVLELSARFIKKKDPEKALDLLVRSAAMPGASGDIYARLSMVYSRLGKDEQAINAGQTAIKRSPYLLAGYNNLFLIYAQKGRAPEALAVLNSAGKLKDASVEFLLGLTDLYTILQRQAPSQQAAIKPAALAVLQRVNKEEPTTPLLRLKLAEDFDSFGDSTNAARIYLDLLNHFPDLPALEEEVRPKLVNIYLRNNDAEKLGEQLRALIKENPANAQAYSLLGMLAYEAKKLPEAEDHFQKALLLRDDVGQVYYDLAGVQLDLDKGKAALETLTKARKRFHESFKNEFLQGIACSSEKDFTNALTHFTSAELLAKASEPNRLDQHFYFQVGSTYERKGDFDQAEQYFEKSLKLQPDFAEALNYFGYMLADRGVKLDRARELIEKAVTLEPKNAAFIDSLGWVYYKLNRDDEARDQILKAIELSEKPDATLFDHLGDIYAALKQPDKAREAWRKSLAVEPNEQIQKKLGPDS